MQRAVKFKQDRIFDNESMTIHELAKGYTYSHISTCLCLKFPLQISLYSRSRCVSRNLQAAMLTLASRLAQRVQLPRLHRLRKKHFNHVSESTTGVRVMLLLFAAAHALSDSRSVLAVPAKRSPESRVGCAAPKVLAQAIRQV